TSVTEDGGNTWRDATRDFQMLEPGARNLELARYAPGQYINRFRVIGGSHPVVYAAGNTVYKYTDAPVWEPLTGGASSTPLVIPQDHLLVTDGQVSFTVEPPADARRLIIDIYDRFAGKVRTLVDDDAPAPGPRPMVWDIADDHGRRLPPGAYVLRVSCDHLSESRMIFVEPDDDVRSIALAESATTARRPGSLTIPYRLR
ncbi:MAG TPA: FlgD immunoglobulin-like domain containing protein, partial [Haliangium sp.]|nr:FlgD immunoglobulin-like domain containing protein [Haliangium sp.]